jgi:hypothetical protein
MLKIWIRVQKEHLDYMRKYGKFNTHIRLFFQNKFQLRKIKNKEDMLLGFEFFWYDGPFYSLNFWYWAIDSYPDFKPKENNSVNFIKKNIIKTTIFKLKVWLKNINF